LSIARPVHYLAYAETSVIGRAIDKMLARQVKPVPLDQVFVSQLAAVLRSMAREGRGVAWLPESQIRGDLARGQLVIAGGDEWVIPVEIRLFRSNDRLPPKSEQFWSLLVDSAATEGNL
jgi:DNA-binding transcriptional LysR family regulator